MNETETETGRIFKTLVRELSRDEPGKIIVHIIAPNGYGPEVNFQPEVKHILEERQRFHFDQTDPVFEPLEEVRLTPVIQTGPTSGLYNLPSNVAHYRPHNTTDSLEEKFIDEYSLEDTIDYITKIMEDITASNPDFKNQTDELNALFRDYACSIIRNASYNAFQEMMRPFSKFPGTDIEVEGFLLSATVSFG